jgi:hypothetical protein
MTNAIKVLLQMQSCFLQLKVGNFKCLLDNTYQVIFKNIIEF